MEKEKVASQVVKKPAKKLADKPHKIGAPTTTYSPTETHANSEGREENKRGGGHDQKRPPRFKKRPKSEYQEVVVDIARVTKVVKGGRRFSFSAVVVIGNKAGKVGFGHGKANEVPDAIKKAIKDAEKSLITVPIIDNRTVPHEAKAKFLSSQVMIKPAPKGRGLIASSAVRVVVELAGYQDIYTKTFGSRSKQNVVQATFKVLKSLRTAEQIADLRDRTVAQISQ